MSRRILKWTVPVDDNVHPIGDGPVVHVGCQGGDYSAVQVWTDETNAEKPSRSSAQVYGTGQPIPSDAVHAGSVIEGPLVWHVFRVNVPTTGLTVVQP